MAAQPFGDRERDCERKDAHGPASPERARQRESGAVKIASPAGKRGDRNRQQPAEGLGIDQEGVADPVEAGEEISEAEEPAGDGGCKNSAEASGGGAVDQPDRDRKGQEQERPASKGASAKAEMAPATNAIAARRQPQDRTTA